MSKMKNAGRICALPCCDLPASKRHHCDTHYQRLRIHGDASIIKRQGNGVLLKWIDDHKDYHGEDCLPWPFTRSTDGRSQVSFNGRNHKANRVMCEAAHGPPPTPFHHAAHDCGKGHEGCISPKHLLWKIRKENEADKVRHGTFLKGEACKNAKITERDVRDMRARLSAGETCNAVAIDYKMHPGTISQIKRKVRWSWVE